MLSRFYLIPERHGQTDERTDIQNCYINIARQCAIKIVKFPRVVVRSDATLRVCVNAHGRQF